MTDDEIKAMPAGREMDALVALNLFPGYGLCVTAKGKVYAVEETPHYSTDIAAAWEVVLHLMNQGYCPNLVNDDNGHWALSFEGTNNIPCTVQTSFIDDASLWCDTAPHAICRAVLLERKSDKESPR